MITKRLDFSLALFSEKGWSASKRPSINTQQFEVSLAKLPLDRLRQGSQVIAVHSLSIHKHRRRSADADASPVFNIRFDQLPAGW